MINEREIVLDILLEVMEKGTFSHLVIRQALEKYGYLSRQQRAFILRLAEGCIERAIELDAIIDQVSSVKVKKMKPVIRNLLRMTAYQLRYMDSIPDSAACNETVKLAGKRGFQGLKGFVNGVCRSMSRKMEDFSIERENLSVRYSMPEWLIRCWKQYFSFEDMERLLSGFYEERMHQTSVRCNTSRASMDEIIKSLEKQGVKTEPAPYVKTGLLLSEYDRLEHLEAFQEGWIQVQDVSSMLVGLAAQPDQGDYCIDVCAAPGGKSIHLADQLKNTGIVDSRDLTIDKVVKIQENTKRCEFSNIKVSVADATVLYEDSVEKADVLLADLPCSGLGILGNKPDIKYQMNSQKMADLAMLQRKILSVVQAYVKPGGIMIYSTCTINPKENIENVRWLQKNYPFYPESLDDNLCEDLKCETTKNGYLQLLPGTHLCAGFFFAKLRKKREEI